jgi:hypothetical protein
MALRRRGTGILRVIQSIGDLAAGETAVAIVVS